MGGGGAKLVFWSIRLGMMGVRARAVSEKTFLFEMGGGKGLLASALRAGKIPWREERPFCQ